MFKLIKELTFNKFPAVSFTVYFIHAVNNYSGLAVLRQHAIQYYCMHGYSIYFLVVDTMQERTENVLACIYQFPDTINKHIPSLYQKVSKIVTLWQAVNV